jgi:hypothetical protein
MFQHYNSFEVVHLFMFLLLEVPCHHCFVSVSINRLLAHQHQSNIKICSSLEYFEGLVIHTISRYTCPTICRIWSTRQKKRFKTLTGSRAGQPCPLSCSFTTTCTRHIVTEKKIPQNYCYLNYLYLPESNTHIYIPLYIYPSLSK